MMSRRQAYSTPIYKSDFFVALHLYEALTRQIRMRVTPDAVVADIGCGEQPLRSLIEAAGAYYLGVDLHQNAAGTVDLVGGLGGLPLEDASIDLVLCTEVLEHIPDTAAAMRELRRVLRPGGYAILTTPFSYPLHEEPYDFVRLTPYQIRHHAEQLQLQVATLETTGNEIEVIATVWDNLWMRSLPPNAGFARRKLVVLMRLPVNLIALVISGLTRQLLPRRYYLNLVTVLRK